MLNKIRNYLIRDYFGKLLLRPPRDEKYEGTIEYDGDMYPMATYSDYEQVEVEFADDFVCDLEPVYTHVKKYDDRANPSYQSAPATILQILELWGEHGIPRRIAVHKSSYDYEINPSATREFSAEISWKAMCLWKNPSICRELENSNEI